jgi:phosphoribosylglycinamide formyltransferase-1
MGDVNMTKNDVVDVALIASGGGTDAQSIMQSWKNGCMPNVNIKCLISTKKDASCLKKAQTFDVEDILIDKSSFTSNDALNRTLFNHLNMKSIDVVFLVGCIVKINPIKGIDIYNIHPASIVNHGGQGMYGLEVHKHVLQEVIDLISRGRKTVNDRFFTYPTVHEVEQEYDSGAPFLVGAVEISQLIIKQLIAEEINLYEGAEMLQKIVLPYEWKMLPCAVNMAVQKVLK